MSACPHCGGYNGQHGPNCNRSEPWEHDNVELRARVTALEGTVATLRAALERYGHHETDANCYAARASCVCGLTTALETP